MKRIVCIALVMALFLSVFAVDVNASEVYNYEAREYHDDGSYIVIRIHENDMRLTGTKSGNKVYEYYASNGELQWSAVLFGNFTYTGATSSCSASSVSVTVYNTEWRLISKESNRNGNTAFGEVTMERVVLGVTISKITRNMSLTCDANGNLS